MDDSFVNLGEEVILTLLWQSGASESATVYFIINLIICYWLLKCGVLCVVCVCSRLWERETRSHNHSSCANTYELHYRLSHDCYPFGLELVIKLWTLLTVFTLFLKAEAYDYRKGSYISNVFDQSQYTGSVGQSEQTVLVRRRDFIENVSGYSRNLCSLNRERDAA